MSAPAFWSNPIKYMAWAAHERPQYFFSILIGASGPVAAVVIPPIRRKYFRQDAAPIPQSYPSNYSIVLIRLIIVPSRKREKIEGFEDP